MCTSSLAMSVLLVNRRGKHAFTLGEKNNVIFKVDNKPNVNPYEEQSNVRT